MYARKSPAPEVAPPVTGQAPTEATPSNSDVIAQHDTPGHIGVGDSVGGASVEVHGVVFTPGEVNALVDYVGPPSNLQGFTSEELLHLQSLLKCGETDAAVWDAATHGLYTALSQQNGDHFAPGPGADFEESFVAYFSASLLQARAALASEEGSEAHESAMNQARLWAYSAEHYLEDAFAGGHQVSAGAIEAAVAGVLASIDGLGSTLYPAIGAQVWAAGSAEISAYEWLSPTGWSAIDSLEEWEVFAVGGGLYGGRDGMCDAVRKHIHEEIGEAGVEVASPAHPAPWVLPCDEGLAAGESPETAVAIAAGLSEVRDTLEVQVTPGCDPESMARAVFAKHRPVPTGNGQAVVDEALARATADPLSLASAVASGLLATLPEVMSTLAAKSLGSVRRIEGFGPTVREVFAVPGV